MNTRSSSRERDLSLSSNTGPFLISKYFNGLLEKFILGGKWMSRVRRFANRANFSAPPITFRATSSVIVDREFL